MPARILIVEDHADLREILKLQIQGLEPGGLEGEGLKSRHGEIFK